MYHDIFHWMWNDLWSSTWRFSSPPRSMMGHTIHGKVHDLWKGPWTLSWEIFDFQMPFLSSRPTSWSVVWSTGSGGSRGLLLTLFCKFSLVTPKLRNAPWLSTRSVKGSTVCESTRGTCLGLSCFNFDFPSHVWSHDRLHGLWRCSWAVWVSTYPYLVIFRSTPSRGRSKTPPMVCDVLHRPWKCPYRCTWVLFHHFR